MITLVFAMMVAFAVSAPAQTLTSLNGENINVEGRTGKVVVLAVGASWLPLSKEQAAIIARLEKKYAGKAVEIYFVATDSTNAKSKNYASDDALKAFALKNKIRADIMLRDSDGAKTLRKFAIDQLPSFVILDKNGRMSGDAFGGIDPEVDLSVSLAKAIDKLL